MKDKTIAQFFQQSQGGTATAGKNQDEYITQIYVNQGGDISFVVRNQYDPNGDTLSLEVMLQAFGPWYVSTDPQIELEKDEDR